jgi:uncharacterized DUF497 family protein
MKFEFNPDKSAANLAKHGLELKDGLAMNLDEAVIIENVRVDYRETRYRAFGRINGSGYCLALTLRGDAIRLINFCRAHQKEMARYGK